MVAPVTVEACVNRLVKAGKLDRKTADEAIALYKGTQGTLGSNLPPSSAAAASALQAAQLLQARSAARRASVAKQAIAYQAGLGRVVSHPAGPGAGLAGILTRDMWNVHGQNVYARSEALVHNFQTRFKVGIKAFSPTALGWRQDTIGVDNMIDEIYAVHAGKASVSGNPIARAAAEGWKNMTDWGIARAIAGGRLVSPLDEWRLPQFWTTSRVRKHKKDWFQEMGDAIQQGRVTMVDGKTGGPLSPMEVPARMQEAFDHITDNRARGGGVAAFAPQMRLFRFNDAATYKQFMHKYGPGQDVFGMMMGHMKSMADEIAFIDVMGPDYQATFKALHDVVVKQQGLEPTRARFRDDRDAGKGLVASSARFVGRASVVGFESPQGLQRTFDTMMGSLSVPESELWAAAGNGLRSWQAAAQLGSATIPAVLGDPVTMFMSSRHAGIAPLRVIGRAMAMTWVPGVGASRQIAERIGITAAAASQSAIATKRFMDDMWDSGIVAKVTTSVLRASIITRWTESAKTAFNLEMSAFLAEHAHLPRGQTPEELERFFDRYEISPADWDTLRATPAFSTGNARFFDYTAVADDALREKLLTGVMDEQHMAVLEPDARVKGFATGGTRSGTFVGEVWRSGAQYKSFPMTMVATHFMRAASQSNPTSKAVYLAQLALYTTIAGGAMIQARSMTQGREPDDMSKASFWGRAALAGGGLGIFGDLLVAPFSRADTTPAETFLGPVMGSLPVGISRIISEHVAALREGEESNIGRELVRFGKSNAPGTSLWYSRLVTNRLVWDQLQMLVDRDYRRSFRRTEQRARTELGSKYWFRPGETRPEFLQ